MRFCSANGTYAYFTVNGLPGGVWLYKLALAEQLRFTLLIRITRTTTSSVIADFEGNLY